MITNQYTAEWGRALLLRLCQVSARKHRIEAMGRYARERTISAWILKEWGARR